MECPDCKIAAHCPKFGSSPLIMPSGLSVKCRIIGGYGKQPVDPTILSEESKALVAQHGPCLTIVEVPELDEGSGLAVHQVVKVFAPAVFHDREAATPDEMKMLNIRNQRYV